MKQSFVKLVETIRGLQLTKKQINNEASILIGCSKENFPNHLLEIYNALEEFDNDTSSSNTSILEEQNRFYKSTIESLVEMIKSEQQDTRNPHSIIEYAIKVYAIDKKTQKKEAKFELKPNKEKKSSKIDLDPLTGSIKKGSHEDNSIASLQKKAFVSEMAAQGLGHALAEIEDFKEKARKKATEKNNQLKM